MRPMDPNAEAFAARGKTWDICLVCRSAYALDHLVIVKPVPICRSCAAEREAAGGIPVSELERVTAVLLPDVAATTGRAHDRLIGEAALRRWLCTNEPGWEYVEGVAEDVQQDFHDLRLDTTWPTCPHHANHPLWLEDGWWCCNALNERVARLGQLAQSTRREV